MKKLLVTMLITVSCLAIAACGGGGENGTHNEGNHAEDGHDHDGHDHGDAHDGEQHDLGHRMKDGIHYGVTQIGDVEGGKEGIFEVHVMKDKDHLSDAQVSVWIGDKDGKELEERSAGEWRADEDCFDCHVRVPKDMPEGTKLFVLIRKGDLEIKDSFELGHDE
ncbi:MAG: hypothetical protein KDB68_17005 [Planctomycetes bacterium]|nr:hypothetical protein [Planctomycetota bacterium]MCA8937888.1 hypothetical protein [Planctomycetota bacterium]